MDLQNIIGLTGDLAAMWLVNPSLCGLAESSRFFTGSPIGQLLELKKTVVLLEVDPPHHGTFFLRLIAEPSVEWPRATLAVVASQLNLRARALMKLLDVSGTFLVE